MSFIVPEEQDLANALLEIANKYGKFNEDETGIWAGYKSPEENDVKDIGVKCGNCVLYRGGDTCAIIALKVEEEGKCRFAVIPDGEVTVKPEEVTVGEDRNVFAEGHGAPEEVLIDLNKPEFIQDDLKELISKDPKNYQETYVEIDDLTPTQGFLSYKNLIEVKDSKKPVIVYKQGKKMWLVDGHHRCGSRKMQGIEGVKAKVYYAPSPIKASVNELQEESEAPSCPPATQDIQLNLENRQNAIDNVGYGPLNPAEPNDEFWQDKADRWNTTTDEAKSAVCGNCIFFVRTPKMLDCLEEGIGLGNEEAEGSIEAGELGYCNSLDFKCASERTCNAWAAGGPVTEETPIEASADNPCWDGYVQIGMKEKDGKQVPNCVPADEASLSATAGSKPAPKKDQIKGSKKNPKGSASTGKNVKFTAAITKSLEKKVKEHNEKAPNGRKVTLAKLKAVYRRGAGAFSTSHRPDQNRNSWAMARVNAFLHLVRTGSPKNKKYVQDNDLLPKMHPKAKTASAALIPLLASLNFDYTPEDFRESDLDGEWLFDCD